MVSRKFVLIVVAYVSALLPAAQAFGATVNHSVNVKGHYACSATGNFIGVPGQALVQLTADGKGNLMGGSMTVQDDSLGTSGSQKPTDGLPTAANQWFYFTVAFQQCQYSLQSGTYSINLDGTGTAQVSWGASENNAASPIDCTENITAHYNLLVQNASAFLMTTNDPVTTGASQDFASLGEGLTGSCAVQTVK